VKRKTWERNTRGFVKERERFKILEKKKIPGASSFRDGEQCRRTGRISKKHRLRGILTRFLRRPAAILWKTSTLLGHPQPEKIQKRSNELKEKGKRKKRNHLETLLTRVPVNLRRARDLHFGRREQESRK